MNDTPARGNGVIATTTKQVARPVARKGRCDVYVGVAFSDVLYRSVKARLRRSRDSNVPRNYWLRYTRI